MELSDDFVDAMTKAAPSAGSNYLQAGQYLVTILSFTARMSGVKGKTTKTQTFVPEFVIDTATSSGEPDTHPNAPGQVVSCVWQPLIKEAQFKEIKAFICAATNKADYTDAKEYKAVISKLVNTDVLRGIQFKLNTYSKTITPKDGRPPFRMVLPRWERTAQTTEQVLARRAKLDNAEAAVSEPIA